MFFLSSGIALIFWSDGAVLCQCGHTLSLFLAQTQISGNVDLTGCIAHWGLWHTWFKWILLRASMILFWSLINAYVRFPFFSSGFWTSLNFSSFASTGGLRLCNFFQFKIFSHSRASTRDCVNDKTPTSEFTFLELHLLKKKKKKNTPTEINLKLYEDETKQQQNVSVITRLLWPSC